MHPNISDATLTRRTMLGGLVLTVASALQPAHAFAEGGLKGNLPEDPASDDALAELGITGEHRYRSPQFDYRLEWSRDLVVDEHGPGESNSAEALDILVLAWADADRVEVASAQFYGFTLPRANIELLFSNALDAETVAGFYGSGYEADVVLADRDGDDQEVAYRLVQPDVPSSERWMLSGAYVLDENLVLTANMLLVNGDVLEAVCTAFAEGISLNDVPLFRVLRAEDILEAYVAGR